MKFIPKNIKNLTLNLSHSYLVLMGDEIKWLEEGIK